ncbi:MAG TPA: hypothetical protein DCS43_14120 [Verrucomicrobia bacterium]|nr:hypothetical protein [Verrucomicrobiota bacterium]
MQIPVEYGHMNAARRERLLPAHRNAGLELVYVENGYVTWDYEGKTVHVPPGHVSFSWPWERHGACNGRLSLVELYWVILPLQSGLGPVREPCLHGTLSPLLLVSVPVSILRRFTNA